MTHFNETHSGIPCGDTLPPNPSFNFLTDGQPKPPDDTLPAVLLQRSARDPLYHDGRRFVAVQKAGPSDSADEHLSFWMGQLLTVGIVAEDDIKAGAAMWDQLNLNIPLQLTEKLLLLKNVDEETARAVQSALIGTFNSSFNPADLEAAMYTLSTFLNVHPSFSHMAAAPESIDPFHGSTTYELAQIGTVQD